jgi:hypothetical protein
MQLDGSIAFDVNAHIEHTPESTSSREAKVSRERLGRDVRRNDEDARGTFIESGNDERWTRWIIERVGRDRSCDERG